MSAQPISRSEFLASVFRPIVSLYRRVFTPRVKQALIALTALAACIGLAILSWQLRHILAFAVGMVLVYFGILLAWELFPFSEQTRAKWARERELDDRYMSYRLRGIYWFGVFVAASRLWHAHVVHQLDPATLIEPALFLTIGAIAYGVWHLRKRTLQ
jgi:hypothetical protein